MKIPESPLTERQQQDSLQTSLNTLTNSTQIEPAQPPDSARMELTPKTSPDDEKSIARLFLLQFPRPHLERGLAACTKTTGSGRE